MLAKSFSIIKLQLIVSIPAGLGFLTFLIINFLNDFSKDGVSKTNLPDHYETSNSINMNWNFKKSIVIEGGDSK